MSSATSNDFDWNSDNDSVVLWEQPATAIYRNNRGQVVVRQQADAMADEDTYLLFAPENVPALIRALRKEVGLAEMPTPSPTTSDQATKDGTGAARQRRFRQRYRETNGTAAPQLLLSPR